jgi:hypothetical protein
MPNDLIGGCHQSGNYYSTGFLVDVFGYENKTRKLWIDAYVCILISYYIKLALTHTHALYLAEWNHHHHTRTLPQFT